VISQGPFTLTVNTVLPLHDPGANSNNPAVSVQIQNSSPFIVSVNSGGTVLTIQPFTAQTVATSGGGQQMSLDPLAAGGSAQTVAASSLVLVWLLAGEVAPMLDGALTAAAIATSIGQSGLAGAAVLGAGGTIASGGNSNPTLTPGNSFRLWNWGYSGLFGGTTPTTGFVQLLLGSIGQPTTDLLSVTEYGSARLAGLLFTNGIITVTNGTNQAIGWYIDYSVA
jgi:hypothetical protein